jgi:hypothetical protein
MWFRPAFRGIDAVHEASPVAAPFPPVVVLDQLTLARPDPPESDAVPPRGNGDEVLVYAVAGGAITGVEIVTVGAVPSQITVTEVDVLLPAESVATTVIT